MKRGIFGVNIEQEKTNLIDKKWFIFCHSFVLSVVEDHPRLML